MSEQEPVSLGSAMEQFEWYKGYSKGPYLTQPVERRGDIVGRILESRGSGGMGSDVWSDLEGSIATMVGTGFWNPIMEERLTRIASFGCVYVERYAESVVDIIRNDEASLEVLDQQYKLALNAYRRMGKRVGSRFVRSYQPMLELGQDVDVYFAQVAQATEEGGSYFGGKFADSLPDVIKAGGDIDEFRTYAGLVRNKLSYKASVSYMNLAPAMLDKENGKLYGYARVIVDGIKELGSEITYWAIPALVHLYPDLGMGQEQLVQKLASLREQYGDKAVGWLAYGLSRLGKAIEWQRKTGRGEDAQQKVEEIADGRDLIDPFAKSFLEILTNAGMGTAIFYARSVGTQGMEEYKDQILSARNKIGKSTFSSAAWVIQKACTFRSGTRLADSSFNTKEAREMIAELEELSGLPASELREMINYTYGAVKQDDYTYGFVRPTEKAVILGINGDEFLPEDILITLTPEEEDLIEEKSFNEDVPFFEESDMVYVSPLAEISNSILMDDSSLGEEDMDASMEAVSQTTANSYMMDIGLEGDDFEGYF